MKHGFCEFHTSRKSAGEGCRALVATVHEFENFEHFVDAFFERGAAQSVKRALNTQIFNHAQNAVETGILKGHSELSSDILRTPTRHEIVTEYGNASLEIDDLRAEHLKECRLARAVGPQESMDESGLQRKLFEVERRACRAGVHIAKIFEFDQIHKSRTIVIRSGIGLSIFT